MRKNKWNFSTNRVYVFDKVSGFCYYRHGEMVDNKVEETIEEVPYYVMGVIMS